jgi:heme oxygenase
MRSQMQLAPLGRRRGGTAVATLRRATTPAHRRLERELGLMSPDLTMDGYRALLRGFAAVHQTLDDEIVGQLESVMPCDELVELDVGSRRRMPSLARDLELLCLSRPASVTFQLTSPAGALGALYVSEGGTLGGRVIAPHVRAVLGADTPVTFFESPGVDVAARWATCRRAIDRLLATPADTDEATAVATAVFDCFASELAG